MNAATMDPEQRERGPLVTIKHRHPITGATLVTTGRLLGDEHTTEGAFALVQVRSVTERIDAELLDLVTFHKVAR